MVFYGPDNIQVDSLILFLFNSFMSLSHFKEKKVFKSVQTASFFTHTMYDIFMCVGFKNSQKKIEVLN